MRTTATRKGQIVIPVDLRRKYGIAAGTQIQIIDEGTRIVLKPVTPQYVRNLRGLLTGNRGSKVLAEERRKDKDV